MTSDKKQTFMKGALILMIANIIVKVIGAAFKIPLTYLLGEEGMALFSTSYTMYTWLFIVATAGIPVAISRMISEAKTKGNYKEVKRIFCVSRNLLIGIGVFGTLILYFGAGVFSDLLKNPDAELGIKAISPAVLFVALMSAYRGFFQGHQDMFPTAFSEVTEAIGKLVIGFLCAYFLMKSGVKYGAAGAVLGVAMGGFLGFLTLFCVYNIKRKKHTSAHNVGIARSNGTILKELVRIAVPITLGASVFSLTTLIDTAMIMHNLQSSVFSYSEAKHLYGSYTGYAVPLFNLPPTLISAITISLVPAVAAAVANGDMKLARQTAGNSISITTLFALPCAVGIAIFAEPILALVYNNTNATNTLSVLGYAIVFVSLVMVTNAILQSVGKEKTPVINMLIGGVVKIVINASLVKNPQINIVGAPIGTISCYGVILILNMFSLVKVIKLKFNLMQNIVKPVISVIIMAFCSLGVYKFALPLGSTISLVAAILVAAGVYSLSLLMLRTVTEDLLCSIPGMTRFIPILKKLHLIKTEEE